jgi:hypothetical protein
VAWRLLGKGDDTELLRQLYVCTLYTNHRDFYSRDPLVGLHERFPEFKGVVYNHDGIAHLKTPKMMPMKVTVAEMRSHDFL